ncbi:hypothetical protein CONPUDRAFT_125423 [Coniophora puteana RWD-64-598 SS2]|uniref:Ketoreductase (KR) domain-containing protein n=1 Tax=Coniophora puteana (strain RWD-64-598) TaxID=741705 RepID=A0A5M3MN59_CONPW|nr:uncharacterized protein CONPUDRAFT_125423 [Coniophora puteana RWD-64-598 SS2]EIW80608.1 hypothetical protein CONPUDRAFT_125423 [Coniophora puteana RWD-64-598 SS2]
MVLKLTLAAVDKLLPSTYYLHVVVAVAVVLITRVVSQGRRTTRDRDMHGRIFLVTGGFTPLGITLLEQLAARGAHIIALSPKPINAPEIDLLVSVLRQTTSNEQIYAEECDLSSPPSIRAFCTRFLTGQEQRLDGIVFVHEYAQRGSLLSTTNAGLASTGAPSSGQARRSGKSWAEALEDERKAASLATFLIITLLLPVLLVAPVERDIRIVSVVNPFYAAASSLFSTSTPSAPAKIPKGLLGQEGWRALQMSVYVRHLQRVLDALPNAGQVPKTDEPTVHVVSDKLQKSNIVSVSVCPGISRLDTVAPLLGASRASEGPQSKLGTILYILLQPLLWLFAKSTTSAVQSILHVLFLPTPFKSPRAMAHAAANPGGAGASDPVAAATSDLRPEEILKPGALYRECAVVNLPLPIAPPPPDADVDADAKDSDPGVNPPPNDNELGGMHLGQAVWEHFEVALKEWEAAHPSVEEKAVAESGQTTTASVDQDASAGS